MKAVYLMLITFLLSACTSMPRSAVQTVSGAEVTLSRPDQRDYWLVNANNRIVARTDGSNAVLRFSLPAETRAGECFQILRDDGRSIFEDQRFALPLAVRYRDLLIAAQQAGTDAWRWRENAERARQQQLQSSQQMRLSRAFTGSVCALPAVRPLPPMPVTKCDTETECKEQGAAICFTRFLGLEGCSRALKEINVSGFLASPGCAAAAAQLAGEKYELEDAVVDVLHGVVDDVADQLTQSDSGFNQFIGELTKLASLGVRLDKARACTDDFVQRYYGPKRAWAAEVERIRAEPAKLLRDCQSAQSTSTAAARDERSAEDAERIALEQKAAHERELALLKSQRPGLARCN